MDEQKIQMVRVQCDLFSDIEEEEEQEITTKRRFSRVVSERKTCFQSGTLRKEDVKHERYVSIPQKEDLSDVSR